MPLSAEDKAIINSWKESPIKRHYDFSKNRLWSKQEEILWSVRTHKKTTVKSGNTVGKTHIAADVCFDFLTINQPAKVITTAPTWTQVESVLWKEIALYYNKSRIPLGGELFKTHLSFADDWFALGISTNEVYRLQGFHSPNLLVVIDEASGVPPEIWEAVESLHPSRVLAIGNPNEVTGNFYDSFSSDLWNKITISCLDCAKWQDENGPIPGLTTWEWINERKQEWGEASPEYQIHVLGEFPEEGPDTLISRAWVERCRKNNLNESKEDGPRVGAVDVATKHGGNLTVLCNRYGHTIDELRGIKVPVDQTIDAAQRLNLTKQLNTLVIDTDGTGEGVTDVLVSRRVAVNEFHGGYGHKAIDHTKFRNLRSQFYWIVAKKFEKGMYDLTRLPEKEYELLKNQLCSIKAKLPDALGRTQIETKEGMMARGVKSPDYADAFMMAEYGFWSARYDEVRPYAYR